MPTNLENHPHVEMLRASNLTTDPDNPRTHSKKQLAQLARSIERFGFAVPVIIDDDNLIVAGNARLEAAAILKIDTIPCIRMRFVSDADRRAFMLAENRIASEAGWDKKLLQTNLKILADLDYDLDLTGFGFADMDLSIGNAAEDDETEEVELPPADAQAISRDGDLWQIGPHRLYCGNSLDIASYEKMLGQTRASMIFADPPYNVPINGHVSGLGKVKHREFAHASGEMSQAEFTQFLRAVFKCCVLFSTEASIHYQCMDWRHIREMLDAADGVYASHKQLLVWKKGRPGMGAFYRSAHELIFAFKSGKGKYINNFGLGETGRYRTNVLEYASVNTFRTDRDSDLETHPTVKPTALVADLILDCSNKGDVILDPFCGSGTTLLAAELTGRRGAAIEIDPLYVDAALRRLRVMSGIVPVHADGRDFDEIMAERLNQNEEMENA